jgi:polar amino acid transport system permease protein
LNSIAIIWSQRDLFIMGLGNTIALSLVCIIVSVPLGAFGAILLSEARPGLRRICREAVDLMRCVPFLLLAYIVYYGLPEIGLRFNAWSSGLATLIIYNTAYITEIFRGAISVLPREDLDAASAFGFTRPRLYRRIVFPQVVVTSAPVIGNQVIVMIKDSALLMIITVQELTFAANFVNTNYFSPFAPFALAMALYWGLCLIVECGIRQLGRIERLRHG